MRQKSTKTILHMYYVCVPYVDYILLQLYTRTEISKTFLQSLQCYQQTNRELFFLTDTEMIFWYIQIFLESLVKPIKEIYII